MHASSTTDVRPAREVLDAVCARIREILAMPEGPERARLLAQAKPLFETRRAAFEAAGERHDRPFEAWWRAARHEKSHARRLNGLRRWPRLQQRRSSHRRGCFEGGRPRAQAARSSARSGDSGDSGPSSDPDEPPERRRTTRAHILARRASGYSVGRGASDAPATHRPFPRGDT
jgi:hypothetical protein